MMKRTLYYYINNTNNLKTHTFLDNHYWLSRLYEYLFTITLLIMILRNKFSQTSILKSSKCITLATFNKSKAIACSSVLRRVCSDYSTALPRKNDTSTVKHIPLLFEIKILHLLANTNHSPAYDNVSEIINIIASQENLINQKLFNNIVDYMIKEYEVTNNNILAFKLSTILKHILVKYFKNGEALPAVVSHDVPMLNEHKILKIVQIFNKIPVNNNHKQSIDEMLYDTIPLMYKFYYENYTTIKDYKYGNDLNSEEITSYIKLPLLPHTNVLRSISKDNHRLSNGIDIIKLNCLNNNYNNKGAGNAYYSSLTFGVFRTGVKNHFTRMNYLPYELKKDDFDITLSFTDKDHLLKQFANHKLFLNLQMYQIELIIKKMYLYFDANLDLIDEKACLAVMNQFFNHLDSFINLDPHQYQSKNLYSNTLLNSIKVSDFPHLHHMINNNSTFIKNLVDKQLFYKVVKRKLVDRKIKYYNFKDIDEANAEILFDGKIIDSLKDQEKYIPYRRISRSKRCQQKKKLLKTIHFYCINYYPKYLLKIIKKDQELAVKVFSSFNVGYLERRRGFSSKKLPTFKAKRSSNSLLLDPIKNQRFNYNRVFNPYNKKAEKVDDETFIPRNLTLLKIYLKFLYMNLNNELVFDMSSAQEVLYLKEKISLLQNFQDDQVFSAENSANELPVVEDGDYDEITKSKLVVNKLLFQFCGLE